jgi:septal ring-binding cell division protein DamX
MQITRRTKNKNSGDAMSNSFKYAGIIISICSLGACSMYNPSGYNSSPYNQGTELYPEGYENTGNYSDYPGPKQPVSVPESYHVNAYHAPAMSKDVDHQWVSGQNATAYTIEVAEGEQPAEVASALMKTPKSDRSAQIKYQQGDTTRYKGIYGSYKTMQDAEIALQKLPDDVKARAQIKSFGSVQQTMGN